MNLRDKFHDHVISYLLENKAPASISYSSNEETVLRGFWAYIDDEEKSYVILSRKAPLTYECRLMDAPTEAEREPVQVSLGGSNGYTYGKSMHVRLFYNGLEIRKLHPTKAYFYGRTKAYVFIKWFEEWKYRHSISENHKALSQYSDRLRLLEALIEMRNKRVEDIDPMGDSFRIQDLLNSISKHTLYPDAAYEKHIDPILKGLETEGALSIDHDRNITVLPGAWKLVSDYYLEERRHRDNQRSLKLQRLLTGGLVFASLANIFKDEVRNLFGL